MLTPENELRIPVIWTIFCPGRLFVMNRRFFVHIAQVEEQPALNRQVPGSRPGVRSMHRAGRRGDKREFDAP